MQANRKLRNRKLGWLLGLATLGLIGAGVVELRPDSLSQVEVPPAAIVLRALDMENPFGLHRNEQAIEYWTNGDLLFQVELPPAGGRLWVEARGTLAAGQGPRLSVLQGDQILGRVTYGKDWQVQAFPLPKGGTTRIVLRYDNDAVVDGEDRNLELRQVQVEPAGTGWTGSGLTGRPWGILPISPLLLAGFCCLGFALVCLPEGRERLGLLLAVCLVARLPSVGHEPWEADEFLFSAGVLDYDIVEDSPQPPGCPLWIGLGKLLTPLFEGQPHRALSWLALVFSCLLTLPLYGLVRRLTADEGAALAAVLLYQFAPAVWLHSARAFDTGPSLFFLLLALDRGFRGHSGQSGLLLGLCLGLRPQMGPIVLPALLWVGWSQGKAAASLSRTVLPLVLGFAVACLAWLVPAVLDPGLEAFLGALRRKGGQTLEQGLRIENLPGSLFEPLWMGSSSYIPMYALAGLGTILLALRRARSAGAFLLFSGWATIWILGYHGPLARYRLPLLIPVAILAAYALARLSARQPWLQAALLGCLTAWLATAVQPALATLSTQSPPTYAFLKRLLQSKPEPEFYVFPHSMWPVLHYGRLLQPGFPQAREQGRLEGLPADRRVLVVEDWTDQPCPRPEGLIAGWEWIDPALAALDQGRYARLFLLQPTAVFGQGWWSRECLNFESWRWMGLQSEIFLAPASQGRLDLAFEIPESLLGSDTQVQLDLVGSRGSHRLDRFAPQRFEIRQYHLEAPVLGSGWMKLQLVLSGVREEDLFWDGRHRAWKPFRLGLRLHRLDWTPKPIDDRASVR